jgi:hypothetical protein
MQRTMDLARTVLVCCMNGAVTSSVQTSQRAPSAELPLDGGHQFGHHVIEVALKESLRGSHSADKVGS